ncbi:hypothetical protein D3C72_1272280 [compost metagenome]
MLRRLDLVGQGDRVVFHRNPALAVVVGQEVVVAHAKRRGALARFEDGGRRQEGPVQHLFLAQRVQEHDAGPRFGLVGIREFGRVDQHLAGGHQQAARAAHHQQARHARVLHGSQQRLGVGGHKARGADHRVVAGQQGGQGFGVGGVALLHGQAGLAVDVGRIAGDAGHLVAALEQFVRHSRAYAARNADQCDFHGLAP